MPEDEKTYTQNDVDAAVANAVGARDAADLSAWALRKTQSLSAESVKTLASLNMTPQQVFDRGLEKAAAGGFVGPAAQAYAATYLVEYARSAEESRERVHARVGAILDSPAAKGRWDFAVMLACESELPAEAAIRCLEKMPLVNVATGFNGRRAFGSGKHDQARTECDPLAQFRGGPINTNQKDDNDDDDGL